MNDSSDINQVRRGLLIGGALSATAAALPPVACAQGPETGRAAAGTPPPVTTKVGLRVNGQRYELDLDTRTTLLDMLREHLRLTGTKKGCDQGQCGACTVHLDGQRVLACLTLARQAEGSTIATIEGLAGADGTLHAVQAAFLAEDAFQCGFCTPGQIMSAVACIREGHAGSEAEIREYMSGNLCRCGAYPHIVAAVQRAAAALPPEASP